MERVEGINEMLSYLYMTYSTQSTHSILRIRPFLYPSIHPSIYAYVKTKTTTKNRDLSLENVMLNEDDVCQIIDLGMCARVPMVMQQGQQEEREGTGGVEQEHEKGQEHHKRLESSTAARPRPTPRSRPLMMAGQEPRGKAGYMSPEVWRREPSDGFSADVWSLGIMLYIMYVCMYVC